MSLAPVLARCRNDREAWRYTDLAALLPARDLETNSESLASPPAHAIDRSILPSVVSEASLRLRLVFVDGVYDPRLSHGGEWPQGVQVKVEDSMCSIAALADTCLATAPIELVFVHASSREFSSQLAFSLGESSRLTVIEHHISDADCAAAHVMETSIALGPYAKLSHSTLFHGAPSATCLSRTQAQVGKGAFYRHFALIKDTRLVRNEIHVNLQGEQAQVALDGAMLLREREHADTYIKVLHAAPYATSRQFYKSIAQGRAKGVFQGKIIVEPAGQHADAQQVSRTLLLSDQAEMDAKPELEIYADDVHCSHGCASGNLDDEALFYLRSRGLTEKQARAMLLRAFVDEVLHESHAGECASYAQDLAERWFDNGE